MALYKLPQEKYEQLQIILTEISVDEINEVLDSIFLKNKELIKKYYIEQYAGKWMFPPVRRYGVADAEKDTQKLLNTYEVSSINNFFIETSSCYNNPAVLVGSDDITNFSFMYNTRFYINFIKDLLKEGYTNVYLEPVDTAVIDELVNAYDSGEIQEVISYYKEQKGA